MDNPLVSVFIAAFNAEEYIYHALDSIVNQTYKNLEIIIVNDGSKDNTLEIINSFKDKRIRLINLETNKGIPYVRNVGLKNANGKYLVIMDSDDISYLHRIEKQVYFMESNPNIVASGALYEYYGSKLKRKPNVTFITPEQIKIRMLFSSPIANPTAIIRMDTIKKNNLRYNSKYFVAQDYDMWFQLSKYGDLSILPEILLKYRIGHSNITKQSRINKAIERKKIIDQIHQDILNYYGFNLSDKELKIYNDLYNDNPYYKTIYDNNTIKLIPELIERLCQLNSGKKIFQEKLFEEIILQQTLVSIGNLNIGLRMKLDIYNNCCKLFDKNIILNELVYLNLKHIFNILRDKI